MSDVVLAASPVAERKLSSFIGVRAKPTMAYFDPRELCTARSNMAGITFCLARSPDAPNRIMAQGSHTPPSIGLVELDSAAIHSPRTGPAKQACYNPQKTYPNLEIS